MNKKPAIACAVCGFVDRTHATLGRCSSCGAKFEGLPTNKVPNTRRSAFNWEWFAFSLGVSALLTAAVVYGLPNLIPLLDFEGSAGILVAIPTWFVGALLVGLSAPGKRLFEPVVATLVIAVPTVTLLYRGQTVKTLPLFVYLLLAMVGLLFALLGAHAGERLQVSPRLRTRPGRKVPPTPRAS
jgi:hypothetical protein